MTDDTDKRRSLSELWQWLKTPPQLYGFYLVCLILVWLVSFYAGTLSPRRGTGFGPPPTAAPVAPPVSAPKN